MNNKVVYEGGSRTALIRLIRRLEQYESWKRAVFVRDRFTCQHCGKRNGRQRIIEADHIETLAKMVSDNSITCLEEAVNCPILWDVNNGRTLCHSCHEKTDTYPEQLKRKNEKSRKKVSK